MVTLAREIEKTKNDLYMALDAYKTLGHKEVYALSSQLDKLIFEYELKVMNRRI
ncbi:MAG: aspartyl-phosphate phosphatase Spo0E family protein [Tepidanaerobacteraceae bacterium]|jgi:hypothetical protein|nr:aspartyl-phosphate phosphatase Spo0E family protein [Thermoanaerobacterales bacterium]